MLRRGAVLGALVLLLALPAPLRAQSRVGTTAATFLTLGTGARGQSLGHAYTALATGADALFWNPGGAARLSGGTERGAVLLSHHTWVAGIDYNAAGVVLPITGAGVLGLSIGAVDYGREDVTTEDLPEGTGETWGASDLVFGLSYAQPLTESFYIGGTGKLVRQQIRDMSASTFAFDLGFVLEMPYLNGAQLAASIQNFGGKMRMEGVNARVFVDPDEGSTGNNPAVPGQYQTARWDLPLSFRVGLAVPAVRAGNFELLGLTDVQQTNDNNLNADVGAQAGYRFGGFGLSARAGYHSLSAAAASQMDNHWSFGGGLDFALSSVRFGFDYAYLPFDNLGETQLFDLRFYF